MIPLANSLVIVYESSFRSLSFQKEFLTKGSLKSEKLPMVSSWRTVRNEFIVWVCFDLGSLEYSNRVSQNYLATPTADEVKQ